MQGQRSTEICQVDYMNDVRRLALNDHIMFPPITIQKMFPQVVFEDEIREVLSHGNSLVCNIMESSPSRSRYAV